MTVRPDQSMNVPARLFRNSGILGTCGEHASSPRTERQYPTPGGAPSAHRGVAPIGTGLLEVGSRHQYSRFCRPSARPGNSTIGSLSGMRSSSTQPKPQALRFSTRGTLQAGAPTGQRGSLILSLRPVRSSLYSLSTISANSIEFALLWTTFRQGIRQDLRYNQLPRRAPNRCCAAAFQCRGA